MQSKPRGAEIACLFPQLAFNEDVIHLSLAIQLSTFTCESLVE